jgi:hypothetical protein
MDKIMVIVTMMIMAGCSGYPDNGGIHKYDVPIKETHEVYICFPRLEEC